MNNVALTGEDAFAQTRFNIGAGEQHTRAAANVLRMLSTGISKTGERKH